MVDFIRANPFKAAYDDSNQRADAAAANAAAADLNMARLADADADRINKAALEENIRAGLRGASVPPQPKAEGQQAPTVPPTPRYQEIGDGGGSAAASSYGQHTAQPGSSMVNGGGPQAPQPSFRRTSADILSNAYIMTPGYAAEGLKMQMEKEERELATVLDLARSDPQSAISWADANGVPIPDGMKQALMVRGFADYSANVLAQMTNLYPNSPEKRFKAWMAQMEGYMQAVASQASAQPPAPGAQPANVPQQDPTSALRSMLPDPSMVPEDPPAKPQSVAGWREIVGENGNIQYVNPNTKEVWDTGAPAREQANQGQNPAMVKTIEYMVANGIATDRKDAFRQLQTAKDNPTQRARLVMGWVQILQQDISNSGRPVSELQEEATRIVDQMLASGVTAAPEQAPAPPPAAQETRQAPDGNEYPVVSNEQQYDALPPGSVYFHAGQGQFLTKGGQ